MRGSAGVKCSAACRPFVQISTYAQPHGFVLLFLLTRYRIFFSLAQCDRDFGPLVHQAWLYLGEPGRSV